MEDDGSDGEIDRDVNRSPVAGSSKRPKRQMKTPFQLEMLEKTYSMEMYPSEQTRAKLSEKLGLSDRQLQMWFCHKRLKEKKESSSSKPRSAGPAVKGSSGEHKRDELMETEQVNEHGSGSESSSGSGSSQFDNVDEVPMEPIKPYESPRAAMLRRVISCVEAQLGELIREDAPILGIEFDELPPGAFGTPIGSRVQQGGYGDSYDGKLYAKNDANHMKEASSGPRDAVGRKVKAEAYTHVAPLYNYNSPVSQTLPHMLGDEHAVKEYGAEVKLSSVDMSQQGRQVQIYSSPLNKDFFNTEDNLLLERKRKGDGLHIGGEVQGHEKKFRKEFERQDLLRRKRDEQMKKEMERQDRERQKEEQRILREQQKLKEKFQREEKREMERTEKFMQKELLMAERRKQKEDMRKEKEAARQKAAMVRAAARRIAKEYMELIEDERLELMELAASSKGLPSIVSLDYDTLQNLESFREALCEFPPKSVQLKLPFGVQPWINSEENVGNLLMVWKFCITFADVLQLWPFTLDEFVQAFHDYDSRLLSEIHTALLKLIVKDIEDVVRTPSGGPGTNQYSAINPEGGHPHIVEGAYLWGFDIRNWQKHLNPSTWPEVLRQFSLSAGLGPQLKKKGTERVCPNDDDESKSCKDIVSTLRNGSAAQNAVVMMKEKGLSSQRKSKHRLTPGTVKFAAYHVLALEGSKGLNLIQLAEKIQKSGLRDLSSSRTPEASISVALSRDPILFERIAPCTYCVRTAFRKDPAEAETVIATAKEMIQKYANLLAGQNADEEKDDDSDSDAGEGTEVDVLGTPVGTDKETACNDVGSTSENVKDKLPNDAALQNVFSGFGNPVQGVEIDESRLGEPWVQGLTEGEYSDLSIEERLNILVVLIGVANEGNSIRVILEDRMDAANALKKQMLAESQLDKRRLRDEFMPKFCDSSFNGPEGGLSPMVGAQAEETSLSQQNGCPTERSRLQLKSYIGHRAEETYAYRSLPLGQDRRRNRYWHLAASASYQDPGSGRVFVESPNGFWRVIDSVESFQALLTSLDTRGTRESHLHIMLQKIERCFKECVRRSSVKPNLSDENGKESLEGNFSLDDSPNSEICGITNTDTSEASNSFRIDFGRKTDKLNFLKRYEDLKTWIWKECFKSSTLYAIKSGKTRCSPLLRVCDTCLGTYDAVKDMCSSCEFNYENSKNKQMATVISNLSTPGIRLIKALLNLVEASVPSEALRSSWTEATRNNWGLQLQNSSSADDLLQVLTQFENAIKRDHLASDFEATEELLSYSASSKGAAFSASVPQLPWVPKTTAAVALRILELDASICYTPDQRAEIKKEKNVDILPKAVSRYAYANDIQTQKAVETTEFDRYGLIQDENWDNLRKTPGSTGNNKNRNKGGRPRGKSSQKRAPPSKRGVKNVNNGESLTQALRQQSNNMQSRGRRTVRKRPTGDKKAAEEFAEDYLYASKNVPETPVSEELVNNFTSVKDEVSGSESDDENAYELGYNVSNNNAISGNNEMMEMSEEEEENGYYENLNRDTEMNDYQSEREGNVDEGFDSGEDYSD